MSTAVSNEDFRIISDELEGRPAEHVLAWAADRFAGRIVLTCSWQMQSSVLVDMIDRIGAEVRIAGSTRACSSPRPTRPASG